MIKPSAPPITTDTPIGADVDLESEDIRQLAREALEARLGVGSGRPSTGDAPSLSSLPDGRPRMSEGQGN